MPDPAPYAVTEANSRGRCHNEPPPLARGQFQRDRDRIVHSTAFRRLEYKTQVFVNHEGDLFRTRLTHSLEVAQIARGIARLLAVNEDLVEAIALAHDLGHTPFGHAGQDALNACMKDYGGFEHNLQSLRTVDELEESYADFNGLNLCFETREGILKHCSRANAVRLGALGRRFLEGQQPSLEAQICNLADEIAYNNHDVDDGLRSGLLTLEQLATISAFSQPYGEALAAHPGLTGRRLIHETVRRMINRQVLDLIEETSRRLNQVRPTDVAAVRNGPPLVAFSDAMGADLRQLKVFLRENLYQHYRVRRMTSKARRIVTDLFVAFMGDYRLLPTQYQEKAKKAVDSAETLASGPSDISGMALARQVSDYIAGMTDRYAMAEHRRMFAVGEY